MATAFLMPAAHDAPTLGFFDIMRRLGTYSRSLHWQVRYLDGLIERYGFPRPYPFEHRKAWVEGAHPKARWPRRAVEAWEHDRLPPDAAAAIETRELEEAGARMSARATALFAANDPDFPIEHVASGGVRV